MARRACLAIGIGDAPPLTYLGGDEPVGPEGGGEG